MLTLETLRSLPPQEQLSTMVQERLKCESDPIYTITTYMDVVDPALGIEVPFVLYPYQEVAIRTFEEENYSMTMKSRQTGLTTISEAYTAWYMITRPNMVVNALAQDKKRAKKFLKGVRGFLDNMRKKAPWLVPGYSDNNNGKEEFSLKNGSLISAEANKPDACRGETINLLIIDEVAAISWMEEIWSSAGLTLTRSRGKCIAISTPKGQAGWYFEQYTNAEDIGWAIIDAHWTEHPIYKMGMYQWIEDEDHKDGGYVKYFNDEWPTFENSGLKKIKEKGDYKYLMDGRIRSPWYDFESKRLGVRKTRCELDCSFAGSGGEVLDPEIIRAHLVNVQGNKPINKQGKGIWTEYRQYKKYNSLHSYILASDVATGDGSDYSAFVVYDIQENEIVATYKDKPDPKAYARVVDHVGREYGCALVIIEHQIGITTLLELKDTFNYPKIYYTTLKQKEVEKRERRRKLGFWQSDTTRTLGGDSLEEELGAFKFKITCPTIITELHTWVWSKRGRRDHASGKHDDLIMAMTMLMYYLFYVATRRDLNNNMMKKHFGINRHSVVVDGGDPSEAMFDQLFSTEKDKEMYDKPELAHRRQYMKKRGVVGVTNF